MTKQHLSTHTHPKSCFFFVRGCQLRIMSQFVPQREDIPRFWPLFEFIFFAIGQILSMPCYLFVFYEILHKKSSRESVHNHSILIMLFYNFVHITIDLSLTQNYIRLGYVFPYSPLICLCWKFINFGIWYGGVYSMLWTSFERHILVFHPNLVRTNLRRIFFHYIPLLISSLYVPILYFYLIFLYPCHQIYRQEELRCGPMCFYKEVPLWFDFYDAFINYIIPIVLIVVFSLSLVLRFIKQKRRLRQAVRWRHCRKMVFQLILISTTHLFFDLPYIIIYVVQLVLSSTFANQILSPFLTRLTFLPGLILPFAILLTLPSAKYKLYILLFFWKRNRHIVVPMTSKY